MDEIAEQGFAAHWKYKDGGKTQQDSENELDRWLFTIKEILDDPQPNAMDFLDAIKLNLYAKEIFVVTPKGEFRTMPAGCTVLDFAFSVHTTLGTHCIGAKVNHTLVPLSHKLESGDQVEILTGRNVFVAADWLNYVTTAKAKTKVQAILRRQQRQLQKQGEEMLLEFLAQNDLTAETEIMDRLCRFHQLAGKEQLCFQIGSRALVLGDDDIKHLNEKSSRRRWRRFIPFLKASGNEQVYAEAKEEANKTEVVGSLIPPGGATKSILRLDKKKPLLLNEETISKYLICEHCHPIPGDDVLAFQNEDGYVTIHKRQCSVSNRMKAVEGNNILAAVWDTHKVLYFPAVLHVEGIDRVGVLYQMTGILSQQMNLNISSLSVQTNNGIFSADIVMEVHDLQDLKGIIRDLKKIKEIEKVIRTD
jgi:GTP pyrophosphokinase